MNIKVSAQGAQNVAAALEAIGQRLPGLAAQGLERGLAIMAADARSLCPQNTGALRDSIYTSVSETASGATGKLGAGAGYAAYVELGTKDMQAKPFLYPAYQNNRDALSAAVAGAIAGGLG